MPLHHQNLKTHPALDFTRNPQPGPSGSRRFLSRFLAQALAALALLALCALPARAADNVPYLDAAGVLQHQNGVTEITAADCGATLAAGWYVASSDVTCVNTITINGNVNLILADDASLSVTGDGGNAGINVTGANSLTVYAQSTGAHMGSLTAHGGDWGAGIGGGDGGDGGSITLNGGAVTAAGGTGGAGIGGGYRGNGGNIAIHGGAVTATGDWGAGIGGGSYGNGGAITLTGGAVHATGGAASAGIGGGSGDSAATQGASGDISITGSAEVTATGGDGSSSWGGGAGIGSGGGNSIAGGLGTLVIGTTGTVSVTSGGPGASTRPGGAAIGTGGSATGAGVAALFLVTSSASGHGSVAPLGTVGVAVGSDQTYAITPASGYAMAVTLDGVDVTSAVSGGSYTLTGVAADHVIEARFALPPGSGSAASVPALGDAGLLLLALLLTGGAAAGMRRGR